MLWFLRHAEAHPGHPDEARPLTERGEREARAAGVALARLGFEIETCLSSPKRRALDTATLVCEALQLEVETAAALGTGEYDAEALAAGRGEVLLVGHEPTISQVIRDLTGARVHMKKGAVAAIEGSELRLILTPRVLRTIASEERP